MRLPPGLTLRVAAESDVAFLARLRSDTMRVLIEQHYAWEDVAQNERVLSHFECARIIVLEGQDIGLLKVVRQAGEIRLSQIQICPAQQGRGIASALIGQLKEEAGVAGLPITLQTLRRNRAIALYERLGFIVYQENEHFRSMRWSLVTPDSPVTRLAPER